MGHQQSYAPRKPGQPFGTPTAVGDYGQPLPGITRPGSSGSNLTPYGGKTASLPNPAGTAVGYIIVPGDSGAAAGNHGR